MRQLFFYVFIVKEQEPFLAKIFYTFLHSYKLTTYALFTVEMALPKHVYIWCLYCLADGKVWPKGLHSEYCTDVRQRYFYWWFVQPSLRSHAQLIWKQNRCFCCFRSNYKKKWNIGENTEFGTCSICIIIYKRFLVEKMNRKL